MEKSIKSKQVLKGLIWSTVLMLSTVISSTATESIQVLEGNHLFPTTYWGDINTTNKKDKIDLGFSKAEIVKDKRGNATKLKGKNLSGKTWEIDFGYFKDYESYTGKEGLSVFVGDFNKVGGNDLIVAGSDPNNTVDTFVFVVLFDKNGNPHPTRFNLNLNVNATEILKERLLQSGDGKMVIVEKAVDGGFCSVCLYENDGQYWKKLVAKNVKMNSAFEDPDLSSCTVDDTVFPEFSESDVIELNSLKSYSVKDDGFGLKLTGLLSDGTEKEVAVDDGYMVQYLDFDSGNGEVILDYSSSPKLLKKELTKVIKSKSSFKVLTYKNSRFRYVKFLGK